ncbi:MAG: hypothetical protein PQJ58_12305 [Spirochaetales bacterium]|nr:hypothetical protein [Spirochaetales bacterium]
MKFKLILLCVIFPILLIGCQSKSSTATVNNSETIYFIGKPYDDPEAALLYSVKTDGSELTRIDNLEGWRGRLSPDGKKLLWTPDDHKISVYDLQTKTVTLLLDEEAYNWDSCWSPDGSQIAFASRRTGKFDIWVMDADGSNLRNITNTPDVGEWDPRWGHNNRIYFGRDMIADVGWERVPVFFMIQFNYFQ